MSEPRTRYIHPNVFTVAPGTPFLPALARALCEGTLVDGFAHDGDPMTLARATIYLPTRRAARELRSVFVDLLGGRSALLPAIHALGEFDEDAAAFAGDGAAALDIPPAIEPLERQLALGTLIARWTEAMTDDLHALYGEERLTTPVSTADAFWMAGDLAALIDQMATEGVHFAQIEAAAHADVSQWWQVTLAFLDIVKSTWPDYLAERNRLDPADHRNRMLRAEAARLRANPPDGPVIAAGSTGSIPATAELIATIARLPRGAAVLPGYDTAMDEATLALLDAPGDVASVIGHPQYGMRKLVRAIGVVPSAIAALGPDLPPALAARRAWVAAALAPAPRTADWAALRDTLDARAFDDVAILHAANERAEALAIACALRETILAPGATAALVTPDRNLARRVAAELARFSITADDSGGVPFDRTPHGTLLALVLDLAHGEADPAALLALLKHPLARFGAAPEVHDAAVQRLEMMVLRGSVGRIRMADFRAFAETGLGQWSDERRRKPDWFATIGSAAFDAVRALAGRIETAFAPLCALATAQAPTLNAAARASVLALEAVACDDCGDHGPLYDGDSGKALADLLARLVQSAVPVAVTLDEWPDMVRALTASIALKPPAGGHPRIAIWGTLEARLQTVDRIVLGGLNEGTWPAQTANDAFLSRPMKAEIGLEPPERRIGLAAHDAQMALGQAEIVLTRSVRAGGAPAVASRWLQRLETLAGADTTARLHAAGQRFAELARAVDAPVVATPASRPAPAPPPAARPPRLSVTDVETLRRDPYALYARKVLRLRPLEPLVRDPDFADRGALIHQVMEAAVRARIDFTAPDAADRLARIARMVFDDEALPAEIDTIWWTRMGAAFPHLVAWEAGRDDAIAQRLAEVPAGPVPIADTGVELTGRADRIDLRADGRADIIDFKTGAAPSGARVEQLDAPQLPLEAALLARDGFAQARGHAPGDLVYVRLGPRGEVEPQPVSGGKRPDAGALADTAWDKLVALVRHYMDPRTGYVSHAAPDESVTHRNDYDHLARYLEWANAPPAQGDRHG